MKQKFLLLLATLLAAVTASAQEFTAENADGITIYYNKLSSTTAAVISVPGAWINGRFYEGDIVIPDTVKVESGSSTEAYAVVQISRSAFSDCPRLTSVSIPETVTSIGDYVFSGSPALKSVTIGDSVTSIGQNAFTNCSALLSVDIPDAVTSIGDNLFSGCSSLTSVTFGEAVASIGNNVFYDCSSLTSVTIGEAVTSIGNSAFAGCSSLTSVSIPDAVTSIGVTAFQGCSALTSVAIGNGVTSIGNHAFSGCSSLISVTIGDALTSIGNEAFFGCSSLTSINIPDTLTSIGNEAFFGCSNLTSINIPDAVTSIGESAFVNCSALTSIDIPDAVTSIGNSAFVNCYSLTSVTIGNSLTSIGSRAFEDCFSLTSVTIPDAVTAIGSQAFIGCSSLTTVSLPAALTSIGSRAFEDCSSLTTVNIPAALTSIGSRAFKGCSSLTSPINIPDGVTAIAESTFQGCTSLEEVGLGAGVESVDNNAFADCTSLLSVDIKGTITSLSNSAWNNAYPVFKFRSMTPGVYGYNSCTMTVPHDAVEAYRKAWPDYMVNIVDVALPIKYEINTSARSNESDIVKKVLAMAQAWDRNLTDAMLQVMELKVIGTINSYDIMALHNKAINLTKLDLSEAQIVANSYEYYQGLPSVDNEVGKYFLYNMRNLQEVWLPNSAVCINSYSVNLCPILRKIVIGNQTTELKDHAFSRCSGIRSIDIPDSVISIGNYAFENCTGLITIHTGHSTQYVGDFAFYGCKSLKSLTVGDATTSLGNRLCHSCNNLQTVVIGQNAKIGVRAFADCGALESVTMGDNVTFAEEFYDPLEYRIVYGSAFYNCTSLEEVTLPKNLEVLQRNTFSYCTNLKTVHFPPRLEYVGISAFNGCSSLTAAILPTTLKQIGADAFSRCSSLSEVKIPASITVIGDYAFRDTNIDDIYTWTIEPTNINQNTFPISIFTTALLHVPATANKLYYYDTQWSQFLRITNFFDPYEYFYLTNKDLIIDYETSRLQGLYDETTGIWKYSDADLGAGSGLLVEGEEPQYLGNVRIVCDGKNSTAIIGGNSSETESGANLNIDNLVIEMNITKNKWYFYCFPFDLDYDMMQYDGQFVWRYYDGAKRAANGSGGWTSVTDGHLNAMQGYIFQGSVDGTLSITVPNVAIDGTDKGPQIYTYVSANSRHASWNLVGNPNIGYYAVNDLDYEAPLTTWNGTTYEAFRPGDEDDDVTLHPYQAFFVQTPQSQDTSDPSGLEEATVAVWFDHDSYMTRNQSLDPNYISKAAKRRAKRHQAKSDRTLINLVLATDTVIDRTRVVFNNDKSMGYEIGCDAAKFISDQVAQIYTVDSDGNQYSINERPTADYIVKLGFTAPSAGTYTIRASRSDVVMEIYDVKANKSSLLTEGYTFTAGKGTDNDRFILRLPYGTSGVESVGQDANSDAEYIGIDGINYGHSSRDGFMIEKRGNTTRKVYNR